MIEDTPEIRKLMKDSLDEICAKIIKRYPDEDSPWEPQIGASIAPREDGRNWATFEDYLSEAEEGESWVDYVNRVGVMFKVIQLPGYYSVSFDSIDDAIEKWNAGDIVDISKEGVDE